MSTTLDDELLLRLFEDFLWEFSYKQNKRAEHLFVHTVDRIHPTVLKNSTNNTFE